MACTLARMATVLMLCLWLAPALARAQDRPVLPDNIAAEVDEMELRIDEVRTAFLKEELDSIDEAIDLAERVHALRVQHQSGWTDADGDPAEWWEVGDARRRVEELRSVTMLSAQDRAAVLESETTLEAEMMDAYGRGDYAGAAALVGQRLDIRRRVLGDEHPSTLTSINNMGAMLEMQGKLSEAEPYHREALEGRRRALGEDHPSTLTSINNMGAMLGMQGKLSEAEPYHREALEGNRRALGEDHPSTLTSINNMGVLLQEQGKLSEAEPYYREALEGRRRVLGEDHPDTLGSINNMGVLLQAQGKRSEAESYYREALEMKRRVLGDDHPSTLTSINNMGVLLQAQGKLSEAEPYYREALEGSRRVLGDDHPDTLISINGMGYLLKAQGKLSEAEPYYREALEGSRRVLGDDDPDTLVSINNMGAMLDVQGKLSEAEPYYREALEGRRRVLGEDHPDTLGSINNMGVLLQAQGKRSEAESYYREALEMKRRVLGDDHPDTLTSINNMGALLQAQGKLPVAEPYFHEALDGSRRVLGDGHSDTLISINNMGYLLLEQGKLSEAEPYYREALALAQRLRGSATGGERGRAAMAGEVGLRGIVTDLAALLADRAEFDEAWTITEQGRGRALLDLLARSENDLDARIADASGLELARNAETEARVTLRAAESRLAAMEKERGVIDDDASLDEQTRTARLAASAQSLESQHDTILRARRDLGEATAQVFLALQQVMPDARPLTIEQVQSGLEPGELLLGYSWSDDRVLLLIATESEVDGAFVTDDEDDTASLADQLAALRETLGRRPDTLTPPDTTDLLARLVPETLRSQLASAERIIILPDGPLAGLPFETIADGSTLDDDRQQIVYASSATVYLNRRQGAQAKTGASDFPLVALGDPVFVRDAESEPDYPSAGVLATGVVENSNAAGAGLTRGDVILSYGGEDVRDYDHVLEIKAQRIAEVEAGERASDDPMPVRVWRDGETIETTMTPGSMGAYLDQGSPADGLRSIAELSRGMDERIAEASLLDVVRLHGGTLPRLPGTRAEVERIGEVVGDDATILLREDATLANLEASVDGARYVHIATHGLVGSQDRPYDASLALTRPVTPSVDDIGFLTLDHLIRTWRGKLESCDLVTLSACDTQRGIRQGDALMSLPWGFYYAGAPTVVASLWQIDDEATALLMSRFYENLLGSHEDQRTIRGITYADGDTMPKADALQEAKRWLRTYQVEVKERGVRRPGQKAKTERPYEHPYYWAAFVLIGDPA